MANHDKIYEAYIGKMGESFQHSTQNRINWILQFVGTNKQVLDVGCSQGIISILAAQRGNSVTGIDIEKESIEYASHLLQERFKEFENSVTFLHTNILDFSTSQTFDTIILTEVIEHLKQPEVLLSKVRSLLSPKGKVIITTPFGVCNHPDHFCIYYLSNFWKLLEQTFLIQDFEFIEQWMGAVCIHLSDANHSILKFDELIKQQENFFQQKEKHYILRISELNEKFSSANIKYKKSLNNYDKVKTWHVSNQAKISQLKQEKEVLSTELLKANELTTKLQEQLIHCFHDYDSTISRTEQLLRIANRLEIQNSTLIQKNNEQKAILDKIDNNFFGRTAVKLYHLYQKIFRK